MEELNTILNNYIISIKKYHKHTHDRHEQLRCFFITINGIKDLYTTDYGIWIDNIMYEDYSMWIDNITKIELTE
jgi:hypothetical protein